MTSANSIPDPSPMLMQQAMDWLVQLRDSEATAADRQRWHAWRESSPEHERAWQQAESLQTALTNRFGGVPPGIAAATLRPAATKKRRRALQGVGAAFVIGIAVWWGALDRLPDPTQSVRTLRTAVGEQQVHTLTDGTRITLNTASEMTVRYTRGHRVLILASGEALVETGKDAHYERPRPLVVQVPPGTVTPVGTRFTVRLDHDDAVIAVLQGAVRIEAKTGDNEHIAAGQTARLTSMTARPAARSVTGTASWSEGSLIANDQPFCAFLAELARYRPEPMRCDPALETRRISGAYDLRHSEQVLPLAASALDLNIEHRADGTVDVRPK